MVLNLRLQKTPEGSQFIATGEYNDFRCFDCQKKITEGFICENNAILVLCTECQEDYKMHYCGYNKEKQHNHIKFIRAQNGISIRA